MDNAKTIKSESITRSKRLSSDDELYELALYPSYRQVLTETYLVISLRKHNGGRGPLNKFVGGGSHVFTNRNKLIK